MKMWDCIWLYGYTIASGTSGPEAGTPVGASLVTLRGIIMEKYLNSGEKKPSIVVVIVALPGLACLFSLVILHRD